MRYAHPTPENIRNAVIKLDERFEFIFKNVDNYDSFWLIRRFALSQSFN